MRNSAEPNIIIYNSAAVPGAGTYIGPTEEGHYAWDRGPGDLVSYSSITAPKVEQRVEVSTKIR